MTYRELLELYKAGELELEQRKRIEKDIEKQEAISDYLSDVYITFFHLYEGTN